MNFLKFNTFETENIDEYLKTVEERLKKQYDYNKEVFKYDYYMEYDELDYYTSELAKSDINDVLDVLDEFFYDAHLNNNLAFTEFFEDILKTLNIFYTGCSCMPDKIGKLVELYELFEHNFLYFNFPYHEILENSFKNFHFLPWQKENLNTEGYELSGEIEQFLLSRDFDDDEEDMKATLEGGILDKFLSSQGYDIFGELDENDEFIKSFLDELHELPINQGYGFFLSFYSKINLREYFDTIGPIESITFKKGTIVGIGNEILHGGYTLYGIKLKKDLTINYDELWELNHDSSDIFYDDEVVKVDIDG